MTSTTIEKQTTKPKNYWHYVAETLAKYIKE